MSKIPNNQRPRLGRGLSALISVSDPEHEQLDQNPPVSSEIQNPVDQIDSRPRISEIPLDKISPNPHQPRKLMAESSLSDLANSLKTNGLIQPILVRQVAEGYQLIAGERRYRASKIAGLTTIPRLSVRLTATPRHSSH